LFKPGGFPKTLAFEKAALISLEKAGWPTVGLNRFFGNHAQNYRVLRMVPDTGFELYCNDG
jgi:hypothetical protein